MLPSANEPMGATEKKDEIFISWSGPNSKEIAKALKASLESEIFAESGLSCFMSDEDIASGDDWWNKIKSELTDCKLGILCITKENVSAPWLYFEAGAIVARGVRTVPLLINVDIAALGNSPLKEKHCVDFYTQFNKMIIDINKTMKLLPLTRRQVEAIAMEAHGRLKKELCHILRELKDTRVFHESYIYPRHIKTVKKNVLYISAPMQSVSDPNEYVELRRYLLSLDGMLREIGFSDVKCALFNIKSPADFDGNTKAIEDNFAEIKQADSMLVVYSRKVPSSVLVEIGYGIALCKRLVVFHKEGLPYILEDATGTIEHIKTYQFNNYSEITDRLRSNRMHIFRGYGDT